MNPVDDFQVCVQVSGWDASKSVAKSFSQPRRLQQIIITCYSSTCTWETSIMSDLN
jgi:hypothetical protein